MDIIPGLIFLRIPTNAVPPVNLKYAWYFVVQMEMKCRGLLQCGSLQVGVTSLWVKSLFPLELRKTEVTGTNRVPWTVKNTMKHPDDSICQETRSAPVSTTLWQSASWYAFKSAFSLQETHLELNKPDSFFDTNHLTNKIQMHIFTVLWEYYCHGLILVVLIFHINNLQQFVKWNVFILF